MEAQREAAEAYVASQQHEGWRCLPERYDDGGFTGGNTERPALQRLLRAIEAKQIDCVLVYKVDRLSRSLLDFTKLLAVFDQHQVAFVSVTQQFNTANSMGRLILNVLLSFAQFEREIIAERTRDKLTAMRKKGKWAGGLPPLGYDVEPSTSKLVVNPEEAKRVRAIFQLYREQGSLLPVVAELRERGWTNKKSLTRQGKTRGGQLFDRTSLHRLLTNVHYIGKVPHKGEVYPGEQKGLIDQPLFTAVQQQLAQNRTHGGAVVRNQYGALLKGLLHCGHCQCAMTPTHTTKKNRRYRYYACVRSEKIGRQHCPSKSVPAGTLEEFVISHLKCIGRDEALLKETVQQAEAQTRCASQELESEARQWQRDLQHFQTELRSLSGQFLSTHAGHVLEQLTTLQQQSKQAEERLAKVQSQRQALGQSHLNSEDVRLALAQFDHVWSALTPREQNRLVGLLIERVEYDGGAGTIAIQFHAHGIQTLAHETTKARLQETA